MTMFANLKLLSSDVKILNADPNWPMDALII